MTQKGFYPKHLTDMVYEQFLNLGYRRSGAFLYANHCLGCSACMPLRLAVVNFGPSESQKRVLRRNHDLNLKVIPGLFERAEYFELFNLYERHRYGLSSEISLDSFRASMLQGFSSSLLLEYRLGKDLVALSWVDKTVKALNAVYCAFDPRLSRRSLGIYSLLAEIQWAKELGLEYYYLGFWVKNGLHMDYKKAFQPAEAYYNGQWRAFGSVKSLA